MKQASKDPFEAAFEEEVEEDDEDDHLQNPNSNPNQNQKLKAVLVEDEQDQEEEEEEEEEEGGSPPESPIRADEQQQQQQLVSDSQTAPATMIEGDFNPNQQSSSTLNNKGINNKKRKFPNPQASTSANARYGKRKEEDDEEEEENMEVALGKFPSSGDPDKMAKMQEILSRFDEEQMSRYESFRRSGFPKPSMKKLLASITGTPKISHPVTIVVSGIAKMFVGELVETGRVVMTERGETGPIRPCHIREAYRRLKLEGKVPRKSVSRLFR